jgi:protein-disulfide isomerase
MKALGALFLLGLATLACGRSGDAPGAAVAKAEAAPPPSVDDQAKNDPLVAAADRGRITGDSTAKVWLIIVSDFECPYCKMWHDSTGEQVRREYVQSGKIRMAYVNFPLEQHPHAMPSAETAMCAAAQGKFWPVHDRLFQTQDRWKVMGDAQALFDSLAAASGVESGAYKECLSSHRTAALIRGDYARSSQGGVRSTPTFIVGSTMLSGVQPISEMRKAIDAALAATNGGAAKP